MLSFDCYYLFMPSFDNFLLSHIFGTLCSLLILPPLPFLCHSYSHSSSFNLSIKPYLIATYCNIGFYHFFQMFYFWTCLQNIMSMIFLLMNSLEEFALASFYKTTDLIIGFRSLVILSLLFVCSKLQLLIGSQALNL